MKQKRKSPKLCRKEHHKRQNNYYMIDSDTIYNINPSFTSTVFRVGDCINFGTTNIEKKYNIKKVHVARRRQAKKKNKLETTWIITDSSPISFTITESL